MTLSLYTLHATAEPGEFIIQKFDTDYHCESVYALSSSTCMCPQGHKDRCRHRTMLGMFLKHGHIGDGWFLEWDTRMWRRPVNDVATQIVEPLLETFPLADDTVMGTSASGAAELASQPASPPPSPPEGPQSAPSAEAAPASPVVAGAPIVKRRKIP